MLFRGAKSGENTRKKNCKILHPFKRCNVQTRHSAEKNLGDS